MVRAARSCGLTPSLSNIYDRLEHEHHFLTGIQQVFFVGRE